MISYVIDQEDGQTERTDYTDTNISKERRLKSDVLSGRNFDFIKMNSMTKIYERKYECSSTPREIKDQRVP